jgi:hypothetical protein
MKRTLSTVSMELVTPESQSPASLAVAPPLPSAASEDAETAASATV